jgi:hypothetical protein
MKAVGYQELGELSCCLSGVRVDSRIRQCCAGTQRASLHVQELALRTPLVADLCRHRHRRMARAPLQPLHEVMLLPLGCSSHGEDEEKRVLAKDRFKSKGFRRMVIRYPRYSGHQSVDECLHFTYSDSTSLTLPSFAKLTLRDSAPSTAIVKLGTAPEERARMLLTQ